MNALMIANTQIRCDTAGRYCLNDLHQASGGAQKHKPGNWVMLGKTKELIEEVVAQQGVLEIQQAPIQTLNNGVANGTYAIKELVYAYAMWISPRFHLHVIRAYDAMVTEERSAPPVVPSAPMHRSDVLVSAARGFGALMRAARSMGMAQSRATVAANAATYRATGIDLVEELGAGDLLTDSGKALAGESDAMEADLAAWLQGREAATSKEIIIDVFKLEPSDKALQMRVSRIMCRLGWTSRRERVGTNGPREYVWRRL